MEYAKSTKQNTWKIKIQIHAWPYTSHWKKNAGTNMIHTEDQTIRTIHYFCAGLDDTWCDTMSGFSWPSIFMNGRMIPLGGSLFQNFLKL